MIDFYLQTLKYELLKEELKKTSWKPKKKYSYTKRKDISKGIILEKLKKIG